MEDVANMPRRNKRRMRKRGGGPLTEAKIVRGGDRTRRISFRTYSTVTWPNTTSAVSTINVDATNLGDRITAISDQYSLWRLLRFRVSTFCDTPTTSTTLIAWGGMSFTPQLMTTTPTTFEEILDHPVAAWFPFVARPAITRMQVPSRVMKDVQFKWFQTRDIGDDSLFRVGRMYVFLTSSINASASSQVFVIEGEVEFCNPIDQDINPRNNHTLVSTTVNLPLPRLSTPDVVLVEPRVSAPVDIDDAKEEGDRCIAFEHPSSGFVVSPQDKSPVKPAIHRAVSQIHAISKH